MVYLTRSNLPKRQARQLSEEKVDAVVHSHVENNVPNDAHEDSEVEVAPIEATATVHKDGNNVEHVGKNNAHPNGNNDHVGKINHSDHVNKNNANQNGKNNQEHQEHHNSQNDHAGGQKHEAGTTEAAPDAETPAAGTK